MDGGGGVCDGDGLGGGVCGDTGLGEFFIHGAAGDAMGALGGKCFAGECGGVGVGAFYDTGRGVFDFVRSKARGYGGAGCLEAGGVDGAFGGLFCEHGERVGGAGVAYQPCAL